VLVFRRQRQWLLYYLISAFGLTIQIVLLAEYLGWDQMVVNTASFHVELISKYVFNLPIELLNNGRFQINLPDGSIAILKLGIECSAILESSILFSLIVFYPLFGWSQKIVRALIGLALTYAINIARLMIIVLIAYRFGSDSIFIAHAVVARMFFFVLELVLLWYLMTKPSVKAVGESISGKVPLYDTATAQNAFRPRYAFAQVAILTIFTVLFTASFFISSDWQKAFMKTARGDKPIVYTDETAMEVLTESQCNAIRADNFDDSIKNEDIVDNFNFEALPVKDNRIYRYKADQPEYINLRLVQGNQPLKVEVSLNGKKQFVKSVKADIGELILDRDIFNPPVKVDAGDTLELTVTNQGKNKADYVFEMISGIPCGAKELGDRNPMSFRAIAEESLALLRKGIPPFQSG